MVEVVEEFYHYQLSCDDSGNIVTKQSLLDEDGNMIPMKICLCIANAAHNCLCASYNEMTG